MRFPTVLGKKQLIGKSNIQDQTERFLLNLTSMMAGGKNGSVGLERESFILIPTTGIISKISQWTER